MVRHKTRWLLVKVELADDIRRLALSPHQDEKSKPDDKGRRRKGNDASSSSQYPSRKEFTIQLRRTITWCFGIAGETAVFDTHVRFFDVNASQLVLIRCPRQHCGIIRSALTLTLTRKQMISLGQTMGDTDDGTFCSDWISSVISVHGSARTAKIATLRELREVYRDKILQSRELLGADQISRREATLKEKKLCTELQERIVTVRIIDN
jgi:hypothetical protein